jgi:hypothetical protein
MSARVGASELTSFGLLYHLSAANTDLLLLLFQALNDLTTTPLDTLAKPFWISVHHAARSIALASRRRGTAIRFGLTDAPVAYYSVKADRR